MKLQKKGPFESIKIPNCLSIPLNPLKFLIIPYRKLLARFRAGESGESRYWVCSLHSAGKALSWSSLTSLHELYQKIIHYIKDLKDTKGNFDKDDLIHILDIMFGVEHDYISKDTKLVITVGRHTREADFIQSDLGLNDTQGTS